MQTDKRKDLQDLFQKTLGVSFFGRRKSRLLWCVPVVEMAANSFVRAFNKTVFEPSDVTAI